MNRRLVVSLVVIAVALSGLFLWIRDRFGGEQDQLGNYMSWSPSATAIRQAIGPAAARAGSAEDKARQTQFSKLFQSRFREHDPPIAIGMHFQKVNRIKLMCPARMEPWDMDRVAMSAWHEAQDAFGRDCEIDIYETFIGTPPIKIGELRRHPDRPQVAMIAYRYPQLHRVKPSALSHHTSSSYE